MGVGKGNKRVVVRKNDEYTYNPILPAGKDEQGRPNYTHDKNTLIKIPAGLSEYGQEHLKKETKRKYVVGVPKDEYKSASIKTKLVDAPTIHYSVDKKLDSQGPLIQGPQQSAWSYKKEKTQGKKAFAGMTGILALAADQIAAGNKGKNSMVGNAIKRGGKKLIKKIKSIL